MITLNFRIVLVAVLGAAPAYSAEHLVPQQYDRIQKAIDAAADGDTVVVAEGRYVENVLLRSGITLRGAGIGKTILTADVATAPIVGVKPEVARATVEGLSIRTALPAPAGNDGFVNVEVNGSEFTLRDCEITDAPDSGVWVRAGGSARISGCQFSKCAANGLYITEAEATVESGTFSTGFYGIAAVEDSKITAEGCTFDSHNYAGVYLRDCKPGSFRHCKFSNTGEHGAELEFHAHAQFDQCEFYNNGQYGLNVSGGSAANLSDCRFEYNRMVGIHCDTQSYAFLSNCHATENDIAGFAGYESLLHVSECSFADNWTFALQCFGHGARLVVEQSVIQDTPGPGFMVASNSTAEICNSRITSNISAGVLLRDEGTVLLADDNEYENNLYGDIYRVEGKPLNRQEQADSDLIAYLFVKGDFDALEELESRIRTLRSRSSNGAWLYGSFHGPMLDGYGPLNHEDGERWHQHVAKWEVAHPESVAPLILRAYGYIREGWAARGPGYASETTAAGMLEFKQTLRLAEEVLLRAEAMEEKDPVVYDALLEAGLGLGYSKQELMKLARAVAEIEPDYFPAYASMAFALTPRWGGSAEEIEAFARQANEWAGPEQGNQMYALLAMYMRRRLQGSFEEISRFQWKPMNEGFDQLRAAFPDAELYLHTHAWFAHYYKDRAKAKELFAIIGDNYNEEVWETDRAFRNSRRWAHAEERTADIVGRLEKETATDTLRENWRDFATLAGGVLAMLVVLGAVIMRARRRARNGSGNA